MASESFLGADSEHDAFTILIRKDGTFTYIESLLSSYIGYGNWSVKDGERFAGAPFSKTEQLWWVSE